MSRIIKATHNVIRAQKNGEIRRHRRDVTSRLNVFCMRISSNDVLVGDVG